MLDLEPLRVLLASSLPVSSPRCRLELATDPATDPVTAPAMALGWREQGLVAALRMTSFDVDGAVCDQKDQDVTLVLAEDAEAPMTRLTAYLRAWLAALPAFLDSPNVELLMPHDLVFPEALAEAELQTYEDFALAHVGPAARVEAWISAREEVDFAWLLESHGLAVHGEALRRLQRSSIRLDTARLPGTPRVGASRLGGLPDLPPTMSWPQWGTQVFDFIGQVNLGELHQAASAQAAALPALPALPVLPVSGMLYFFFALTFRGGDDEDLDWRGGGRVLYFPGEVSALVAGSLPDAVEARRVLAPRQVSFRGEGPALPPAESPYYPELLGGGPYQEALARSAETFAPLLAALGAAPPLGSVDDDRPRHRLLGHADPLQSSPNVNCEGYSSGLLPVAWADHPDFWHRAANWSLLLQVDSEPGGPGERDGMLGDGGLLYFMIRPADLAARRFERVWTDWQSH